MSCPKCGAANADDAVFCGLCFETFKPKAKAPPSPEAPPPAAPVLAGTPAAGALAEVQVLFLDWSLSGPLLIRPSALYFFVKSCAQAQPEKKSGIGTKIGWNFGPLGAIVGAAADALTAEAQEHKQNVMGGQRGEAPRPHQLDFMPTNALIPEFARDGTLKSAPWIVACKEYFLLDRGVVRSLAFGRISGLEVTFACLAGDVSLTVTQPGRAALEGPLAAAGWPLT